LPAPLMGAEAKSKLTKEHFPEKRELRARVL
jgi:hypothetical protein